MAQKKAPAKGSGSGGKSSGGKKSGIHKLTKRGRHQIPPWPPKNLPKPVGT